MVLTRATQAEMAQMVDYLKTENRILRSKVPKRVSLTPGERERLVTRGKPLGKKIKELITIVTPRTFARCARGFLSLDPEEQVNPLGLLVHTDPPVIQAGLVRQLNKLLGRPMVQEPLADDLHVVPGRVVRREVAHQQLAAGSHVPVQ